MDATGRPTGGSMAQALEQETIRRVGWRLMPLLMAGYFCACPNRVNVGFAGLTMNQDLGFSEAVRSGTGAGPSWRCAARPDRRARLPARVVRPRAPV